MRKGIHNLADMLAEIADGNLHPEVDTGPPQGNEKLWGDSVPDAGDIT